MDKTRTTQTQDIGAVCIESAVVPGTLRICTPMQRDFQLGVGLTKPANVCLPVQDSSATASNAFLGRALSKVSSRTSQKEVKSHVAGSSGPDWEADAEGYRGPYSYCTEIVRCLHDGPQLECSTCPQSSKARSGMWMSKRPKRQSLRQVVNVRRAMQCGNRKSIHELAACTPQRSLLCG